MRSLVAGIILGVIIAQIWWGLNRPKPTPPPRKGRVIDIFETDEFQEATG